MICGEGYRVFTQNLCLCSCGASERRQRGQSLWILPFIPAGTCFAGFMLLHLFLTMQDLHKFLHSIPVLVSYVGISLVSLAQENLEVKLLLHPLCKMVMSSHCSSLTKKKLQFNLSDTYVEMKVCFSSILLTYPFMYISTKCKNSITVSLPETDLYYFLFVSPLFLLFRVWPNFFLIQGML